MRLKPFVHDSADEYVHHSFLTSNTAPLLACMIASTMTEFPTPQLNKFNGVPALTVDALPTEAELESGAQHAVVWLVGAFARACAQIRETGRSDIAFSDEAFAARISPEIAACLDEQVRWLGSCYVARLNCRCRWSLRARFHVIFSMRV